MTETATHPTSTPLKGLPLSGITIVSCEQAVAAPFATRQLADLGARVIKIERPGTGDFARDYDETVQGLSSHFVWLNRSKESITLDLKNPRAIEVMHRLVGNADVFVQNLAPGAAERLGLGQDELRARYPQLITCSISGYGNTGPYRNAKAYDLLIQSEVGLVSITGTEEFPAKTGIPTADISAGMYAFAGMLSALYERQQTGEGTHVDISLFDSLLEWMGYPLYYAGYSGTSPARTGTSHAAIAPYGGYQCSDGTELILSVQNDREWRAFAEQVLGRPELVDDPRFQTGSLRVTNRDQLDEIILGAFAQETGTEMDQKLETAGIAHARRRELPEVLEHPQLAARDRWRQVESPAGSIRATLPPITLPGREPRMDPIPDTGEHTDALLREAGLSPQQITELRSDGAC